MSNAMHVIGDIFGRIGSAWHNFWNHPAVHWIPASIAAVYHWFHGIGSRGGHKRRMIAMLNMYIALKLRCWRIYEFSKVGNLDRYSDMADWIILGIIVVLFMLRIDRKRSREGDDDNFGYGSLLLSLVLLYDGGSWIFESPMWFLPVVLPGPIFFRKFGISTSFINEFFPRFILDSIRVAKF